MLLLNPPLKSNHRKLRSPPSKASVAVWRIGLARLFDIVSWILGLLLVYLLLNSIMSDQSQLVIRILLLNGSGLIWFLLIFVLIPTVWTGQTLGRWLFKIRICQALNQRSLRIWTILMRESYIVLTPVCLVGLILIILHYGFKLKLTWQLASRISSLNIVWWGFLLLFQTINLNQQIWIDRWLKVWIINRWSTSPNLVKTT